MLTSTGLGPLGSTFNRRRAAATNSNDPPASFSSNHGGMVNVTDKGRSKSLLRERDAKIAALEKEVLSLRNQISNLSAEHAITHVGGGYHSRGKKVKHLTPYGNTVRVSVSKCSAKRRQLLAERARMGRNASISTQKVLNALPDDHMDGGAKSSQQALIDRIQDMFRSPHEHVGYLKSEQFAKDVLKLNKKVRAILEDEPRCVFLQSPAYVFGDIHGNLEDLHFFSDNVWNLGMSLTAGNFVFLGDYVDRGMSCLEVVSYLLAMKLMLPHKVFLLRGNHETRDVNGWEEHYGARSYIAQCRERFGEQIGYKVWESTNQTFDRLPLAAVVDQDIFCVHGGIPRPISDSSVEGGRIKDILNVSKVAGINPPYEHEDDNYQQVASDCIWSDPASEEQEQYSVDRRTGYGDSLRGGGAICFGHKAVTNFLQQQGFSYIMRAHEAHAEGVAVSKGARVFTVSAHQCHRLTHTLKRFL
jgi:diadenosine tetraphosphatase ApaH/serine/threonine PP2A family protein phosphatase